MAPGSCVGWLLSWSPWAPWKRWEILSLNCMNGWQITAQCHGTAPQLLRHLDELQRSLCCFNFVFKPGSTWPHPLSFLKALTSVGDVSVWQGAYSYHKHSSHQVIPLNLRENVSWERIKIPWVMKNWCNVSFPSNLYFCGKAGSPSDNPLVWGLSRTQRLSIIIILNDTGGSFKSTFLYFPGLNSSVTCRREPWKSLSITIERSSFAEHLLSTLRSAWLTVL